MIDQIRAYKRKLRSIKPEEMAMQWLKDNRRKIKNAQLRQMYDWGEDNKGNQIGTYSYPTEQYKKDQGAISDYVTLKDTGRFYESIYIDFDLFDSFEIKSDDPKFRRRIDGAKKSIVEQYSEDVLGLNESSMYLLREELKVAIENKIRSIIHGV